MDLDELYRLLHTNIYVSEAAIPFVYCYEDGCSDEFLGRLSGRRVTVLDVLEALDEHSKADHPWHQPVVGPVK